MFLFYYILFYLVDPLCIFKEFQHVSDASILLSPFFGFCAQSNIFLFGTLAKNLQNFASWPYHVLPHVASQELLNEFS
jgi:hypothetical protein